VKIEVAHIAKVHLLCCGFYHLKKTVPTEPAQKSPQKYGENPPAFFTEYRVENKSHKKELRYFIIRWLIAEMIKLLAT